MYLLYKYKSYRNENNLFRFMRNLEAAEKFFAQHTSPKFDHIVKQMQHFYEINEQEDIINLKK